MTATEENQPLITTPTPSTSAQRTTYDSVVFVSIKRTFPDRTNNFSRKNVRTSFSREKCCSVIGDKRIFF